MWIHPVFHRSLLVPVLANSLHRPAPPPLDPVALQEEAEYKVDSIRDSCQLQDIHAPHLVCDFHAQFPQCSHPHGPGKGAFLAGRGWCHAPVGV
ncbi:hypothetical protein L345_18388, partial [Ophiophagus hannah]